MSTNLNLELNRRKTFQTWPNNAPVDPDTLAKNGFFATGNFLETQCNFCRKIISDWQYNDQVLIRHRRLNSLCPLLVHPNNCNNIPLGYVGETNGGAEQSQPPVQDLQNPDNQQVDLKNEMCRLATFKYWPNPNISPQSLAKAGFYYINQADQVKCAWCKGIIAKWERNDNAFEEHQRFFPDCPRVQLGPLIEIASDGIRDLGIQQISAPKKPKYSCLDARMRTYSNWPISEIQNPEILSQAGFYYQDIDDQVRCFHCNGGLRSWQKEDDPWFEHAKWFPHCQFLKLVKGPNYVTQVQETGRQSGGGAHETNPRDGSGGAETLEPISTLDEAMASEPVQRALEMGLNEGRILNATRRQLEYYGKPFDTTEELVEAVLEGQVDEEDDDNNEQSSSIIREVSQILNNIFNRRNGVNGEGDEGDYEEITSQDDDDFINFTNYHQQQQNTSNGLPISSIIPQLPSISEQQELNISQNNEENNETNQPMSWVNMLCSTNSNNITKSPNLLPHESTNVSNRTDLTNIVMENSTINPINNDDTNDCASNINSIPSCSTSSTSRNPPIETQLSLEEENRKLKDARQCKVCMDDEVGVVFLPCGHLVTCVQCAPGVTNCPLCRSPIKGFVRTFLS